MDETASPRLLWSTTQAADRHGITEGQVHDLIRRRKMPQPMKVGRAYAWTVSDMQNLRTALERRKP